ncbi:MAG: ABC transporter ATP-binding protein [Planctomycetes bacterium]|nr:ABC transporter ATP-binding protein [Planctomycetota bacterium]
MSNVLARLERVSKSFGERRALRELSLEVRAGEVFGLLGPNGAGKTTAVRILCGLLAPDAGQAVIDGHDVAREPIAARRALGYVPDGAPLYANLSADEHLRLVAALHGLDPAESAREAERLLAGFELVEHRARAVGAYSRGMRQKLAIACALLPRPRLLVLDEPLTGLDAPSTATLKEVLRLWADRGGAVLYTSHLLDVVERVCDRMVVVDGGECIAAGSLDELRAQSGGAGPLEQVFARLTHAEDPVATARRILGQ